MRERVQILQELPGLAQADPAALAVLAGHLHPREFKDELICREGEVADRLWILAEGTAEVLKRSPSGRDRVVASLVPVSLFGHVALFTSAGRTATIRAKGRVELLQMSSTEAHILLRTAPHGVSGPFRRALIVALSQQLTAATQTLWRLADHVGATEQLPLEETERALLSAGANV